MGSWKLPCHSSHHRGESNTQFTSQSMTYNLRWHTHIHVRTPSPWRSFHPSVNSRYKTGVNQARLHVMTRVLDVAFSSGAGNHIIPHIMNIDRTLNAGHVSVWLEPGTEGNSILHWTITITLQHEANIFIANKNITFRHHSFTQFDFILYYKTVDYSADYTLSLTFWTVFATCRYYREQVFLSVTLTWSAALQNHRILTIWSGGRFVWIMRMNSRCLPHFSLPTGTF